ncbi:GGDEF domain-containing protein [Candidatus Woesearchaeota archaeon]|nr:GGDEF domain-containing protein [Candidatus Woesearchaeota archaeon]
MEIKYYIGSKDKKLVFHCPSELEKHTDDFFAVLEKCDFVETEIPTEERKIPTPLSVSLERTLTAMKIFEAPMQNSVLAAILTPYIIVERQNIELLKTQELAYRDELTGALNRRAYHQLGEKLICLCNTLKIPLSVMVFDVDNFKQFNTEYGHSGGDYTLKELTKVVTNTIRGSDGLFRMGNEGYNPKDETATNGDVCRIGGDEFVVYFFGATAEQALSAAERVYKAISGYTFSFQNKPLTISISAGIATLIEDGTTLVELYEIADERAEIAKKRGKNQFYSSLLDK